MQVGRTGSKTGKQASYGDHDKSLTFGAAMKVRPYPHPEQIFLAKM